MLRRILIVDDNTDLAEAMSMMLSLCGFSTATAYTGRHAIEQARALCPEIILLDIGLPDMDGYEVASVIRRECELAESLFIAISAGMQDACAPFAPEARFDHYMIKPVDLDILLQVLMNRCADS